MKKITINLLIVLCTTLMCINFTSCNKDPEPEPTPEPEPEEFTIVGKWISTEWFEVDDDGESEGEYTNEFYVIFTETTAKLFLYDCIDGVIEAGYTFREDDNSIFNFDNCIIYDQGTSSNYGLQIVGQVKEATGRLIIQVSGYEDGSHQLYYFRKQ